MRDIQFPITIKILHEEEAVDAPFVAYIPEFDVSSCGKSEKDAVSNVKEVLDIVLEEAKRKGQLIEFLRDQGFRINNQQLFQFPKLIIDQFAFSS